MLELDWLFIRTHQHSPPLVFPDEMKLRSQRKSHASTRCTHQCIKTLQHTVPSRLQASHTRSCNCVPGHVCCNGFDGMLCPCVCQVTPIECVHCKLKVLGVHWCRPTAPAVAVGNVAVHSYPNMPVHGRQVGATLTPPPPHPFACFRVMQEAQPALPNLTDGDTTVPPQPPHLQQASHTGLVPFHASEPPPNGQPPLGRKQPCKYNWSATASNPTLPLLQSLNLTSTCAPGLHEKAVVPHQHDHQPQQSSPHETAEKPTLTLSPRSMHRPVFGRPARRAPWMSATGAQRCVVYSKKPRPLSMPRDQVRMEIFPAFCTIATQSTATLDV